MAFGGEDWLVKTLTIMIPLWLSLSVHEWAHAWSAWKLGDDTAARLGRMTLNPLAHIDPVGTLLLPLMGVPFGWAKPVPVQPHRFTRRVTMRTGMMITAAAGPISNLVLAAISIALLAAVVHLEIGTVQLREALVKLLLTMIFMNSLLALFNLIPVPPLDGSRIADALVPELLRPAWERFYSLGPIALIGLILIPMFLGVRIFEWPLAILIHFLASLGLLPGL